MTHLQNKPNMKSSGVSINTYAATLLHFLKIRTAEHVLKVKEIPSDRKLPVYKTQVRDCLEAKNFKEFILDVRNGITFNRKDLKRDTSNDCWNRCWVPLRM